MLEEIKIIPTAYSPRLSPKQKEWEEDRALLELWPDTSSAHSQSPPRTPPSCRKTQLGPPPTAFSVLQNTASLPEPQVLHPRKPRRTRRVQVKCKSRATTRDPSFDRDLWRRGTIVQLFDKNAGKWVEATIKRVQTHAFQAHRKKRSKRDTSKDGLHLVYKPAKKLKGSWMWKDHKPMVTKHGRGRRVSAIKEDESVEAEWEAAILLSRNSKRLRPAVRVVWDEELKSYLHEEPEECSSSESEPEEYSSSEEADMFWTSFDRWRGDDNAPALPPAWSAATPKSATSHSKGSRQTGKSYSKHTQTTQRTQQSQGTSGSSMPSQGCSETPKSYVTESPWTNCDYVEEEETESESEEEAPIL